ncbi:MAG: hypothetical protein PVI75_02410 [Gammaproteobacteria bacterium]|jgi:hypothetical protein
MSFSFNEIKTYGIRWFLIWYPDSESKIKNCLQKNLGKFITNGVKVVEVIDCFPELKPEVSDLIVGNLNQFCMNMFWIKNFVEIFSKLKPIIQNHIKPNLTRFIACAKDANIAIKLFSGLKSAVGNLIAKDLNKFCTSPYWGQIFIDEFPNLELKIQNHIKQNLTRLVVCAENAYNAIKFFPDIKYAVGNLIAKNLNKFCKDIFWIRYFVENFPKLEFRIQNHIKPNLAKFIKDATSVSVIVDIFPDLKSEVSDLIAKNLNKFCIDIFWIKYFVESFPKLRQRIQVCIIQHLDEIFADLPQLCSVDSDYINELIDEQIKSELFCKNAQNFSQLIESKMVLEKLPAFYGNQISCNCGYWVIDRLQSIFIFWGYKHHFFPAQPSDVIGHCASLMEIGMTLRINEDFVNSSKWGLFNPDQFALIVSQIGYECMAYHANDKDELQFLINQILTVGLPVAIPYDFNDGQPVKHGGESAHWGIVVGVFKLKSNGESYYIYTNSHAVDKNFDFCSADLLCESCGQLENHSEVPKKFKLKNNIIVMFPKTFKKNELSHLQQFKYKLSKIDKAKFKELPKNAINLPWNKIEQKLSPARSVGSFFGEHNSLCCYVDSTTKFVSMAAIQKYFALGLINELQLEYLKKKKLFCPIQESLISSRLFYKCCFYIMHAVDAKEKTTTKIKQDVLFQDKRCVRKTHR